MLTKEQLRWSRRLLKAARAIFDAEKELTRTKANFDRVWEEVLHQVEVFDKVLTQAMKEPKG
jgi:hypothetical protein